MILRFWYIPSKLNFMIRSDTFYNLHYLPYVFNTAGLGRNRNCNGFIRTKAQCQSKHIRSVKRRGRNARCVPILSENLQRKDSSFHKTWLSAQVWHCHLLAPDVVKHEGSYPAVPDCCGLCPGNTHKRRTHTLTDILTYLKHTCILSCIPLSWMCLYICV